MTDPDKKDAMRDRYWKGAARQRARDENERLKKQRRSDPDAAPRRRRRGPRDLDDDWGGAPDRPRRPAPVPATVVAVFGRRIDVAAGDAVHATTIKGSVRLPHPLAVGDTVLCAPGDAPGPILSVEPRRSTLSRRDPANPQVAKVIAANVDAAVVVVAARNPAFKPTLIDRYLVALEAGGVAPLVCVNKVDLCTPDELAEIRASIAEHAALGVPCLLTSATSGAGLDELRAAIAARTVVFTGHSGVGKSALLNRLDPATERPTGTGRAFDGKGRHTTTHGEVRDLGGGTRLIDTPGVRELGLWDVDRAFLRVRFPGFADLAGACRFGDCNHRDEPGCAVRAALDAGALAPARYRRYLRLFDELDG